MKHKVVNDRNVDPFGIIRMLPDKKLFQDCPIKPSEKTIETAEEIYLKLSYDPPHYVSSYDEQIILEWNYYKKNGIKKQLYYSRELVVKDSTNLEWRTFNYN